MIAFREPMISWCTIKTSRLCPSSRPSLLPRQCSCWHHRPCRAADVYRLPLREGGDPWRPPGLPAPPVAGSPVPACGWGPAPGERWWRGKHSCSSLPPLSLAAFVAPVCALSVPDSKHGLCHLLFFLLHILAGSDFSFPKLFFDILTSVKGFP